VLNPPFSWRDRYTVNLQPYQHCIRAVLSGLRANRPLSLNKIDSRLGGSRTDDRAMARPEIWFLIIEHMTIQRMEHVGMVVDDLTAATEFFVELGFVLQGEGSVEGRWTASWGSRAYGRTLR